MSERSDYFFASTPAEVRLQLLEISHPSFPETYRVCRNCPADGITVTHEDPPGGEFLYEYLPLEISELGVSDDLDQGIKITFGDLGEILPAAIDNVIAENTKHIKPIVQYREYRSSFLDAPMFGPVSFQIDSIAFERGGSTFEAKAISVNENQTGEQYLNEQFPMLRGLI